MQIVCPHCSTSYGINSASLGGAGRNVRCSRCKEVWLARPEDAVEFAQTPAMAHRAQGGDAGAEWDARTHVESGQDYDAPHVDSPSITGDWPHDANADWPSEARNDQYDLESGRPRGRFQFGRLLGSRMGYRLALKPGINLTTVSAAMGALVLALLIWRVDVVRLLPQTAAFYRLVGLDVNLRGLRFKDVKISSETVEGKPVLVIEGAITGESSRPVELPRLRFSVRDAQGAEIYAWNAVLEQAVLRPGEQALFKSRLASPPPEGRNIDVRFFNKRDLAGGRV